MKTKECGTCGKTIARAAEACPNCGQPNRPRTGTASLLVGLVLVLVVAAMFAARF